MMKPLHSFPLEYTQHTCGFFSCLQSHLTFLHPVIKPGINFVSRLTLYYFCSLFSSCPLLKLLHITCVHAHTHTHIHACIHTHMWEPINAICRIHTEDSWNGFTWPTCTHHVSVSFSPSLGLLIIFRFLPICYFLYENFSDLLTTASHYKQYEHRTLFFGCVFFFFSVLVPDVFPVCRETSNKQQAHDKQLLIAVINLSHIMSSL